MLKMISFLVFTIFAACKRQRSRLYPLWLDGFKYIGMLENMNIEVKLMTLEIAFVIQDLILKYLDNLRITEYGILPNKILIFFDISKDTDCSHYAHNRSYISSFTD
jgi:hypothetical protein